MNRLGENSKSIMCFAGVRVIADERSEMRQAWNYTELPLLPLILALVLALVSYWT